MPSTWFRPGLKVMNECDILCYDENEGTVVTKRPDRLLTIGDDGLMELTKQQLHEQLEAYW